MTSVERDSPKQSGSSEREARKGSAGKRYVEKKDVIDVEAAKGKDRGRDRDEERRKGRGDPLKAVNDSTIRKVEKRKPLQRGRTNAQIRNIQRPNPLRDDEPRYPNSVLTPDPTPDIGSASITSIESLASRFGGKLKLKHQQHLPEVPLKEEPAPPAKETFKQRYKCIRKIDEGAQGKVYVSRLS